MQGAALRMQKDRQPAETEERGREESAHGAQRRLRERGRIAGNLIEHLQRADLAAGQHAESRRQVSDGRNSFDVTVRNAEEIVITMGRRIEDAPRQIPDVTGAANRGKDNSAEPGPAQG